MPRKTHAAKSADSWRGILLAHLNSTCLRTPVWLIQIYVGATGYEATKYLQRRPRINPRSFPLRRPTNIIPPDILENWVSADGAYVGHEFARLTGRIWTPDSMRHDAVPVLSKQVRQYRQAAKAIPEPKVLTIADAWCEYLEQYPSSRRFARARDFLREVLCDSQNSSTQFFEDYLDSGGWPTDTPFLRLAKIRRKHLDEAVELYRAGKGITRARERQKAERMRETPTVTNGIRFSDAVIEKLISEPDFQLTLETLGKGGLTVSECDKVSSRAQIEAANSGVLSRRRCVSRLDPPEPGIQERMRLLITVIEKVRPYAIPDTDESLIPYRQESRAKITANAQWTAPSLVKQREILQAARNGIFPA